MSTVPRSSVRVLVGVALGALFLGLVVPRSVRRKRPSANDVPGGVAMLARVTRGMQKDMGNLDRRLCALEVSREPAGTGALRKDVTK